ncbi:MAG: Na+/H+ antiporter NhaA [Desulfuromonadales bacterium]|nr:Na+/H+ antiporter NhaA [Desulfuromonadales bacterium]
MTPPSSTVPYRLAIFLRPFENFFKRQASGGVVLLGATLLALLLANSPARELYHHFWEIDLAIGFREFGLTQSLHHWINDGLMAIFFFVVGLELKREFLAGELANRRQAALPIAAAIGGMVVPALIFYLFNPLGKEATGWGIPMATDIAFALGIVALLGSRIPRSLAIFLTALAIVDDLGAVVVIALFYTGDLSELSLLVAAGFFVLLMVGNRLKVQSPNFYALVGFGLWVGMLQSGVHASIAGVIIGITIPVVPRFTRNQFLHRSEQLLEKFREVKGGDGPFLEGERIGVLLAMEHICHDAVSPLQRMEHEMQNWVIFGVMPIFALANAGVTIGLHELASSFVHPVTLGVIFGLLIGKPLGIFVFAWLAVRLGLAHLPAGVRWRQILGIGILGGIGFTMSIFITSLAFGTSPLVTDAKIGIFVASLFAGIVGYLVLVRSGRPEETAGTVP